MTGQVGQLAAHAEVTFRWSHLVGKQSVALFVLVVQRKLNNGGRPATRQGEGKSLKHI